MAMRALRMRQPSVLPGFGLTLGFTLTYLGLIVLVPLGALGLRALDVAPAEIWATLASRRTLTAFKVSFGIALAAAVAGIALTALYADNGWVGAGLAKLGLKIAFTPLGILVALVFVGLPFVV